MEELALRVLQGRATPDERALVEAWRARSPENVRRFRILQAIWDHTGEVLGRVSAPPPDPDAILGRNPGGILDARKPAGPEEGGGNGRSRWTFVLWAAAASIVLLFTASFARGPSPDPLDRPLSVREITTGPREMVTVRLEDGTVVRVAPRSRLEFREGGARQVWLEGRAFLGVAPDPDRPFRVRTAGGDAVALGTRFEVGARDRDLRVLVVEGTVEMRTGEDRVELGPGKLAEALSGGRATVREVDDVLPHLAWLGETLVFRDTRFRDAAREVEHRFGATMRFDSPELAERRITASFTNQELEEVIRVVCRAVNARCSQRGDTVLVTRP